MLIWYVAPVFKKYWKIVAQAKWGLLANDVFLIEIFQSVVHNLKFWQVDFVKVEILRNLLVILFNNSLQATTFSFGTGTWCILWICDFA